MDQKLPKKLGFSFLPIPEELMGSKAISWGAKYLFGIIAKANQENLKWPIRYLSKRMNCGDRETTNRVKELEENNLIIVGRQEKGRVNSYSVNLDLIMATQTPEQSFTSEQPIHQGGEQDVHPIKDSSIKETPKGGEQCSPVAVLRKYFTEQCNQKKGFEPEMAFGKEGRLLKEKLRRFSIEQLETLIDQFFNSRIGEELGFTLSVCLSAHTINLWQAGKLEKEKKPYFQGNPMVKKNGRWCVIENGEWKEFAGRESEIIYQ